MTMPRRDFVTRTLVLMATLAAGGCAVATEPGAATRRTAMFAYVGCYTSKERNGHGEGISVYRIDPASGQWTPVQLVKELVNPSWLTLDHRGRYLYIAHGDGGEATAFAVDADTGRLTLLNRQPSNGATAATACASPSTPRTGTRCSRTIRRGRWPCCRSIPTARWAR